MPTLQMTESTQLALSLYQGMMRIRAFEEKVQQLFKLGKLPGFVHLYIGEEAVAVGACSVLRDEDRITSTHRGHGHLIAKGADVRRMMAELFGRRSGYCKGKGGSMHIFDFGLGILGANGIVGGGIPIATGAALADRVLGRDNVTIAFFGDGAANQGVLHEALNLSAIWSLPVVFLCENNQYTEWMRTEDITAGRIADRAHAFGVPGLQVDGNDVFAVREVVDAAVERARGGEGPSFVEAVTYRHLAHNEGEEAFSGVYRPPDEVEAWKKRDPVASLRRKLEEELGVQPVELETLERRERELVDAAVEEAESAPLPAPEEALDDLFAERTR
jgi:acetoin:2,6-dichlorophenolindophenol oxidoreductase subunit alpha